MWRKLTLNPGISQFNLILSLFEFGEIKIGKKVMRNYVPYRLLQYGGSGSVKRWERRITPWLGLGVRILKWWLLFFFFFLLLRPLILYVPCSRFFSRQLYMAVCISTGYLSTLLIISSKKTRKDFSVAGKTYSEHIKITYNNFLSEIIQQK